MCNLLLFKKKYYKYEFKIVMQNVIFIKCSNNFIKK